MQYKRMCVIIWRLYARNELLPCHELLKGGVDHGTKCSNQQTACTACYLCGMHFYKTQIVKTPDTLLLNTAQGMSRDMARGTTVIAGQNPCRFLWIPSKHQQNSPWVYGSRAPVPLGSLVLAHAETMGGNPADPEDAPNI